MVEKHVNRISASNLLWAPFGTRKRRRRSKRRADNQTSTLVAKASREFSLCPTMLRNRLLALLFYSLAIISACLAAFNLYLLCWIWSSLSGSGSSALRWTEWAKLDLLSSASSIKFRGKLSGQSWIRVGQVSALGEKPVEELKLTSSESISFKSLNDNQSSLLLAKSSIKFPKGFRVKSANHSSASSVLECHQQVSSSASNCHLLGLPRSVKLSTDLGVDANRKSMQVSRVKTGRIHSATNLLQLLSSNSSLFVARNGSVELTALDDIILLSRKSNVSHSNQKRVERISLQPLNDSLHYESSAGDMENKLC